MVLSARGVPRFLPTLTEVVQAPAPLPEPEPDPAELEAAERAAEAERLAREAERLEQEAARRRAEAAQRELVVNDVRAQLHEVLDRRIEDAVAGAMLEQIDAIGDRLRSQFDEMVRVSVDTVTSRLRSEIDDMVREAVKASIEKGASRQPRAASEDAD